MAKTNYTLEGFGESISTELNAVTTTQASAGTQLTTPPGSTVELEVSGLGAGDSVQFEKSGTGTFGGEETNIGSNFTSDGTETVAWTSGDFIRANHTNSSGDPVTAKVYYADDGADAVDALVLERHGNGAFEFLLDGVRYQFRIRNTAMARFFNKLLGIKTVGME